MWPWTARPTCPACGCRLKRNIYFLIQMLYYMKSDVLRDDWFLPDCVTPSPPGSELTWMFILETKQHFHMTETPESSGDCRTWCRHRTSQVHSNTGEQWCSVDLRFWRFWRFWRFHTLNKLHLKTLKHLFWPASAERTSWRSDGDDNENQDDWSLIDSVINSYFNINEVEWMMLACVIIL